MSSHESQDKAIPTHVLRSYVDGLRKKNNRGRVPIEELCRRAATNKDLFSGEPLEGNDLAAAIAAQKGEREPPPISEGTLTVAGLRFAAKEGKQSYNILCAQLDKYLVGGEKERKKLEQSADI